MDSHKFEPTAIQLGRLDGIDIRRAATETDMPMGELDESRSDYSEVGEVEVFMDSDGPQEVWQSSTLEEALDITDEGYQLIAERTAGLPSFVRELLFALAHLRRSNPLRRQEDWKDNVTFLRAVETAEHNMFVVGREVGKAMDKEKGKGKMRKW